MLIPRSHSASFMFEMMSQMYSVHSVGSPTRRVSMSTHPAGTAGGPTKIAGDAAGTDAVVWSSSDIVLGITAVGALALDAATIGFGAALERERRGAGALPSALLMSASFERFASLPLAFDFCEEGVGR